MKNFVLLLLLLSFRLPAQVAGAKSATPVSTQNSKSKTQNSTRAVVVGISDYQDPAIPDLRYADRDAEAFANFLRSPAGGSLPESHVKTLLNQEATTGKIIAALDALISTSKAGDEAIIYFSGHGDVERVTKFQRGYWLTWDSPPAVYAAGAFSVGYLQDIITTLADNGVQVIVVSDACRAGKLAGSEYGGTRATSAALAQQFANEIKILSCQPDEYALEGEQWGGGRGAFSFHLVDALYGMADANSDGTVNLLELGRYLEDRVPAETAPHSQIPFTVGSKAARIARVDAAALAQWRQQKHNGAPRLDKIDLKGLEEIALTQADSSVQALYAEFETALERGDLMEAKDSARRSANALYELLIREPALADLHGAMTRNFAAALMDEGQQFINLLLKSDPQVIDFMYSKNRIDFKTIHLKLKRAADLLGPKHYVYKTLKAKEHYFKAGTYPVEYYPGIAEDSLANIQKQIWLTGLSYDEDAPYLICRLLAFYELDSFRLMANRLEELAPKWALGFDDIAFGYLERGQPELSAEYYKKAIAADSNYLAAYVWLATALDRANESEKAVEWRQLYVQKLHAKKSSNPDPVIYSWEYSGWGDALWNLKRYREAEQVLLEGDRMSEGKTPSILVYLANAYADQGKYEEAIAICKRVYRDFGVTAIFALIGHIYQYYLQDLDKAEAIYLDSMRNDVDYRPQYLGIFYFQKKEYQKSVEFMTKALETNPKNRRILFWLAEAHRLLGDTLKMRQIDQTLLEMSYPDYGRPFSTDRKLLYYMLALSRLGKQDELQACIRQATEAYQEDELFQFSLACFHAMADEPDKALSALKRAEKLGWQPKPVSWVALNVKDPFLDPLRHLPEFQAWEKRWSPPYKDYSRD